MNAAEQTRPATSSKTTGGLDLRTRYSSRLTLLVAPVVCLYLFIGALVTICLTHPPEGHRHSEADGHLHFVCVWVQKGIASHAPSARVILPVVEAILFLLLSLPLLVPHIRVVELTGRSPPTSPAIP
jgi:hypothetical protein